MKHITIVGGGMAGLATAYYLQRAIETTGIPIRYTLIERELRLGGKIRTERIKGTIIEAGPDSYIAQKRSATELVHEVGLGDQLIPSRDHLQRVCIVHRGKLVPFPRGFRLAVPTEWKPFLTTPLISFRGKIRMACDWFIPARRSPGDESLASFLRRRIGEEAFQNLAGPMMSGIYSGDPEQMSIQATFPMFAEMEHRYGSLIRGMLHTRSKNGTNNKDTKPEGIFLSLREGMGALPDAVGPRLTGRVITGQKVRTVQLRGTEYVVYMDDSHSEPIFSDRLILATPAHSAAKLLKEIHPDLARKLTSIRYFSTATVSLIYDRDGFTGLHNGVGSGFIAPDRERRPITACTYSSCKFEHRANEDSVLLRAFIGGPRNGGLIDQPDDALVALVRRELADLAGLNQVPRFARVYRWPNGNPQYDVGHLGRMDEIDASASKLPGLHLTGSSYRGVGVPDVILQGQRMAETVLHELMADL